ncbi:Nitric oxide synthase-interacting protein [Balamuthia mandrillaris]
MSRHSKNNTASSYFTYAERQKLNYGTKKQRLGKDSLQNFDCCCLSLQPAIDPVITPYGHIFAKEAIYEHLLKQKQEYKQKLLLWKEQQRLLEEEAAQKEMEKQQQELSQFEKTESSLLPNTRIGFGGSQTAEQEGDPEARLRESVRQHAKKMKAFWVPQMTPESKESLIPKPSKRTVCPITSKPLRAKELVPITFTPLKNVSESEKDKLGRWMCPLCYTTLHNKVPCCVLKTSRKVMCKACVDKCVLPDMTDPFTGAKVRAKDIIRMQGGGTGYAGKTDQQPLVAVKEDTAFIG